MLFTNIVSLLPKAYFSLNMIKKIPSRELNLVVLILRKQHAIRKLLNTFREQLYITFFQKRK